MGAILISLGGGGGVSSDELTATSAHVLEGHSYVGKDTNDESGIGSMLNMSNHPTAYLTTTDPRRIHSNNNGTEDCWAVANSDGVARVLIAVPTNGYYDTNDIIAVPMARMASLLGIEAGKMLNTETILGVTGTIQTKSARADMEAKIAGWYQDMLIIQGPNGYHPSNNSNGYYDIMLPGATAAASLGITGDKIVKGKSIGPVAGTLAVTSAINFKATALSTTSIRISWTNPSTGPWEGVFIQMSTSGNPGVSGGTRKYTGRGTNGTAGGASNYVDITGLDPATTYYFTCTSYATGLGNGSSYNVSAKTTGMLIYWYGNNVAGIKGKYNNTSAFEEKGGYAYSYNNLGATYTFSIGSLNVSAYTKLKVRLRFTSWAGKYGSYFGMDLLQYNGTSYRDTSKLLSDTATVLTEYTLDISGVSSIPGFTIGQHYWNDNEQGWYMSGEPYYLYAMWCE